MKKMIFYITASLFFIMTGCQNPVQKKVSDPEVDHKAIEKVLNQQISEWQKGNIDGFMEGYWHSDSLQFITKKGIRKGYDSVAYNYKKHYDTPEKRGHLTFIDLKFQTLDHDGEIVQCTGRWHIAAQGTEPEKSGVFSLIFKKIKGDWKIIIDHTW